MSNSTATYKLNISESETVEFKNSLSESEQILGTVSAFSNTKGGIIYIGIADDGSITGVEIERVH